jgi:hypothetical protein
MYMYLHFRLHSLGKGWGARSQIMSYPVENMPVQ